MTNEPAQLQLEDVVRLGLGQVEDVHEALAGDRGVIGAANDLDDLVDVDDGDEQPLDAYAGQVALVVNTASKCGFTPQYADWQKFHEQYGKDIVVLGFPANNFGAQEPGSEEEIATFCQKNYGVTFQLFDKIDVVGKDQHPLYQWLSTKALNGWNDKAPTWNFCKYVVNEKGELTNFFASAVKPTDAEFKKAVGL